MRDFRKSDKTWVVVPRPGGWAVQRHGIVAGVYPGDKDHVAQLHADALNAKEGLS